MATRSVGRLALVALGSVLALGLLAVVAPGGSHWFGRSGNVRGGSPGANIIGLDKSH